MSDKPLSSGSSLTRKKYTHVFKAEYMRQVAAGTRQTDVDRSQGISPALLGRWQRQSLAETFPSSSECEEINRLRAERKRAKQERFI